MNSINKSFMAIYSTFALVTVSVSLEACSKPEVEQAVKPMAQPLMAAPMKTSSIKTVSMNYSGPEPRTVSDVNGNSTAVWEEYDGTRFNIWTIRRPAGGSWGNASLLETDNSGDAYSPQVAVDGIGNVTAVWKQSDGKRFSIYANRFVIGAGWEGAQQIESGINTKVSANAPLVVYDAAGYAMVAWQEADGLNTKIWINHHTGDAGWGTAKQLVASSTSAHYPRFEIDTVGLVSLVTEKPESTTTASGNTLKNNRYKQVSIASAINR
jgi:hypothetical protein